MGYGSDIAHLYYISLYDKNGKYVGEHCWALYKFLEIGSIQEVLEYPTEEMGGYPCAQIQCIRMDADYQSTQHNKRTYSFVIYVYDDLKAKGMLNARRTVEGVLDDIAEAFDEDQLLSGIVLSAQEAMVIAYPAISQPIQHNEKYAIGQIEINVVISFSIT